jgi:hypothetical protein
MSCDRRSFRRKAAAATVVLDEDDAVVVAPFRPANTFRDPCATASRCNAGRVGSACEFGRCDV